MAQKLARIETIKYNCCHQRDKRLQMNTDWNAPAKYFCQQCNACYSRNEALIRHVAKKHSSQKQNDPSKYNI